MKTIAIISQKGGTGKTTTAIHLAVASHLARRPAAIIDLDPQASAMTWFDRRKQAQRNESPHVCSGVASRLAQLLQQVEKTGVALAVIDTAPKSATDCLEAARHADLVIVPSQIGFLDAFAISNSIDIGKTLARKLTFVLLTLVPPVGSQAADQASEDISEQYSIPVSPHRISRRVAFSYALTDGLSAQEFEPEGKASMEIDQLYRWVADMLSARRQAGVSA